MSNLMPVPNVGEAIEKVLMQGDLTALGVEDRLKYYNSLCKSLGLNALTRPFEYLKFQGKTILYARKDCADQLRKVHKVSIDSIDTKQVGDLFVVTVSASIGDRKDSATGALMIKGLSGEALANALMKAETKAKRRVTLSICGLGFLDETEIEDVQSAMAQEKVVESAKRFEEPALPTPIKEEIREGYIAVKTAFGEREKQQKLKSLGFKWEPNIKAWILGFNGTVPEGLEFEYEVLDLNFG